MSNENLPPLASTPSASAAGAPKPGDRAWKDNNPKAGFGAAKAGIEFLSLPVLLEQAVGMMAGAAKYGAHNYLVAGPSVMTYVSACFRHLAAFTGGEEWDPHAGEGVKVHHLTAAQNCLHVVRAAQIQGIAFDDRPPAMPPGFIESLESSVRAIQKNNPDPVARYLSNGRRGPGRILADIAALEVLADTVPTVSPYDGKASPVNEPWHTEAVPGSGDLSRDPAPPHTAAIPTLPPGVEARNTFEVPYGYSAVRDSEGRATGEVRPWTDAEWNEHTATKPLPPNQP